jgi:hypothetical protein
VSYELTKHPALRNVSLAPAILCYLVLAIFFAIGATSHPTFRAKYHNIWEMTHRFGGWTCLILLWIQSFLAATDLNPLVAASKAYLTSPPIWLLTVASMAIIFPWLFLRKVAVRSEVLSRHAVRLWFDYTTPVVGTAVRLAERPLIDWYVPFPAQQHLTSISSHTNPTSQARLRHNNQPRRHPRFLPHRQPRRRLHRPHHRPRALFHLRPRHPHLRRPTHRHTLPIRRPRRHGLRYRPLSRRYHRAKGALPYSLDGTEPRGNVW